MGATVGQAASRGPRRFVIGKFVQYCLGGNWDGQLKPCYGQIDGVDEIARTYKVLPLNSQRRVDRSARRVWLLSSRADAVTVSFSEVQEIKLQILEKYFMQHAEGYRRRLMPGDGEPTFLGEYLHGERCKHTEGKWLTYGVCDKCSARAQNRTASHRPRKSRANRKKRSSGDLTSRDAYLYSMGFNTEDRTIDQYNASRRKRASNNNNDEYCGGNGVPLPDRRSSCNCDDCPTCFDRMGLVRGEEARPDLNWLFDNAGSTYDAEGYRRRLRDTNNAADKLHRRQLAALKAKREH